MKNPSVKNGISVAAIYCTEVGTAMVILATLLLYFISQATERESF